MRREKINRSNKLSLDLTALCDVGFIILFFFLSTSRFVDLENPVIVKLPHTSSTVVCSLLNSNPDLRITISRNEKLYFTISNKLVEEEVLKNIKRNFSTNNHLTEIHFHQLSTLLKLYAYTNNKNHYTKTITLIGDEETSSASIREIINIFQENGINKFSILTESLQ